MKNIMWTRTKTKQAIHIGDFYNNPSDRKRWNTGKEGRGKGCEKSDIRAWLAWEVKARETNITP